MSTPNTYGERARSRGPLSIPVRRLDWMERAACLDVDPEIFFAPQVPNEFERARANAPARKVCAACPVIEECRADADSWETSGAYVYGIRAGEDPKQRNRRRAKIGRLAPGGVGV